MDFTFNVQVLSNTKRIEYQSCLLSDPGFIPMKSSLLLSSDCSISLVNDFFRIKEVQELSSWCDSSKIISVSAIEGSTLSSSRAELETTAPRKISEVDRWLLNYVDRMSVCDIDSVAKA